MVVLKGHYINRTMHLYIYIPIYPTEKNDDRSTEGKDQRRTRVHEPAINELVHNEHAGAKIAQKGDLLHVLSYGHADCVIERRQDARKNQLPHETSAEDRIYHQLPHAREGGGGLQPSCPLSS